MFNFAADYCSFRANNDDNQLLKFLIDAISKYTNNTHPCPFKPPEVLMLKNFVIDDEMFPPIMPKGDYRVDVEYFKDKSKTVRYAKSQGFFNVRGLTLVDLEMG